MTKSEAIAYYQGNVTALARAAGVDQSTVYSWGNYPPDVRQVRLQNRAGVGIGLPLDSRQRLDLSYMHQWNRITPRETHEINHTLVIGWVWTAGP